MLKMYEAIANWWPLLSPVEEYKDEAQFFTELLTNHLTVDAPSLLELGSGGGNNAFYMKAHFADIVLTDLSPHMLALSQQINGECEHVVGDMRSLRLGREFDAVFIHDAIDYMQTPKQLKQAFQTAFIHCKPGGVALFTPDHLLETFESSTEHGGADGEGRALRFLEWTYRSDEADSLCLTDYVYVLHEQGKPTRVEHEQHVFGLFSREDWGAWLRETGFEPEIVRDIYGREIFVGRKG